MRCSQRVVWMAVAFLTLATVAQAAEGQSENKAKRFFKGIFGFPAKTAEKSVEVATDAAKKGTAIGTGEIRNVGGALTGDVEAAKGIVIQPVKGAAETTYETTKGAVMAPVEGAKEAVK